MRGTSIITKFIAQDQNEMLGGQSSRRLG